MNTYQIIHTFPNMISTKSDDYLSYTICAVILILLFVWILSLYRKELFYVLETPRKNMSYDLRGDPFRIPKRQFAWNNSEIPEYEVQPAFYGNDMTA